MQVLHLTPDTTNKLIYYSMSILFLSIQKTQKHRKKKKKIVPPQEVVFEETKLEN